MKQFNPRAHSMAAARMAWAATLPPAARMARAVSESLSLDLDLRDPFNPTPETPETPADLAAALSLSLSLV